MCDTISTLFHLTDVVFVCFLLQGRSEGFQPKTLQAQSVTVMTSGKLTAEAPLAFSPALTLLVDGSFVVHPGGLVQGHWVHIEAENIRIEESGKIDLDGAGYGAGRGLGTSYGRFKAHLLD